MRYNQQVLLACMCHSDIDDDFKRELAELVPLLLAPQRLVEKEISGSKVTCRDLLEYFKVLSIHRLLVQHHRIERGFTSLRSRLYYLN